ncbi:hypothetical protein A1O7_07139 [Cladophialophora yegresii CBS 114405]|uniref:Uncharacterized protein n=1 Tax=Cladophialophora yegresii CBS 114405 TaxID=1182544 RepID=W9VUS6_9EURO|nr:uncharacterized protein A1O7_07139 [Cladophialophora yegresii CBS 114405]EXJ56795.1 hypothetical protein A1O7_07139 [Cladophialophora yegresii CBS 114405]
MANLKVPVTNEVLSSISSPRTSSGPHTSESAVVTITPTTSPSLSPGTPDKSGSCESSCEPTVKILEEVGRKLETLVLAGDSVPPRAQPVVDGNLEASPLRNHDLPRFECAFGFSGAVDKPADIPKTKAAFVAALTDEIIVIAGIQRGLKSYQTAINSGKYHTFRNEFLIDQNTATIITVDQLDQIAAHLKKLEKDVKDIFDHKAEVEEELMDAFRQVQPWVMRARAILRHCHVFYKINFVLASEKKGKQH